MIRRLTNLIKPCYLYAPSILLRRVWMQVSPPKTPAMEVVLPWGSQIEIDLADTIGGAIYKQGIFDIAVSECAWRLIQPGNQIIDAGANIGYMSSLFAAKAGKTGTVHSFEPHPRIRKKLEGNVARIKQGGTSATIQIHPFALGDATGTADLVETDFFDANQGTAFLADDTTTAPAGARHRVEVKKLDDIFPMEKFDFMKIDVEGHEARLIQGAQKLLREQRVRHVVYEDHSQAKSGIPEIFTASGYTIYSIGYTLRGLFLTDFRKGIMLDTSWESPSYLATIDPAFVDRHIKKGWQIFKAVK